MELNLQSIRHFHIDHNEPCLPPKFCITRRNWKQWLCKILGGKQGALWSMWKWWDKRKRWGTGLAQNIFFILNQIGWKHFCLTTSTDEKHLAICKSVSNSPISSVFRLFCTIPALDTIYNRNISSWGTSPILALQTKSTLQKDKLGFRLSQQTSFFWKQLNLQWLAPAKWIIL